MARANEAIEALLQEYSDLLSISGGDPFRVRTYEKAARSVGGYHADLATLDLQGLQEIANVGKSTAEKITEALRTGTFRQLEELRVKIPAGVREMMAIPTLGPKKAMLLHQEFGIASVEELAQAIEAGALKDVKGFGPKTEENILRGIGLLQQSGERVQLGLATELAEEIVAQLSALRGVKRCAYAGSLRRMAETVGDIDVLVASSTPGPIMEAFCSLPNVERVIAHGDTKSSIRTLAGIQVDLRVIERGV